jgi:hypothetical protein
MTSQVIAFGQTAREASSSPTRSLAMPAYGIAHLRSVDFGPGIVEYLQRIDATLEPF